jgi:hypothetical protein
MHHNSDLLLHIIHACRLGVLVLWLLIGMESLPALVRVGRRITQPGDLIACVMLLISISLLTFQIRSIGRGIEARPDPLTASGLIGLIISAIVYQLVKTRGSAVEHKRAVIFAPFGILLVTLAAGALS